MEVSLNGRALIKRYEGLVLKVYADPIGVKTAGWGHTSSEINKLPLGHKITKAQAEKWFEEDLREAQDIVDRAVKVDLPEECYASVVSFCFNVGHGRKKGTNGPKDPGKDGFVVLKTGKPSTFLTLINKQDLERAALELPKWTKADGKVLAGLVRRRLEEKAMFLKGLHEEPCESNVVADEEEKPESMARNKGVQATTLVGTAAILNESASKIESLSAYSDYVLYIFVALTILGLVYTIKSKK